MTPAAGPYNPLLRISDLALAVEVQAARF